VGLEQKTKSEKSARKPVTPRFEGL